MDISDNKLDKIITVVEENLDYDNRCRFSDNCEVTAFVSNKEKVKKFIREILQECENEGKL